MSYKTNLDNSGHNVDIDVDLKEMFGNEISDPLLREEIGLALVETIKERLDKGVFLNASADKTYSEQYKDSTEYIVANKSNPANLQLSGEMLSNLQVIESASGKIKIGYTVPINQKKAFNHHTGDTVPKREFMGFRESEIKKIFREFRGRASNGESSSPSRLRDFLAFLRGLGV